MIPRVCPSYTAAELRATLFPERDAVTHFEQALAAYLGVRHAFVFPYGRSAIHALFCALGLSGDVVQPAYSCVVVAHATVLSGNRPVFIDCQRDDPNQDLDRMIGAVDARTAAVMPTSIFGMTFDAPALVQAVRRKNENTRVIIDCAQCFDARWNGQLLATQGDAAILAFGIGKAMTSLFGGAILTDRDDIAHAVQSYRKQFLRAPGTLRSLKGLAYMLASWGATTELGTIAYDWMERFLQIKFKALRSRDSIRLPSDNQVGMTGREAAVGYVQLPRLLDFIRRRREISGIYARTLGSQIGLCLPAWQEGATHTIYTARLADAHWRPRVLDGLRRRGVQGGTVLDYVVPDLGCYRESGYAGEFPNARDWASRALNLPNHPTLTDAQAEHCASALQDTLDELAKVV